jgi:hypothetical protein
MAPQASKIKALAGTAKNIATQESFQNQALSSAIGFVAGACVKIALQQAFCA